MPPHPLARLALPPLGVAVLASAAAAFGACTQNVEVVTGVGGAGGAGGVGDTGGESGGETTTIGVVASGSGVVSSGSGPCNTPAPVGSVAECTTSAVVGAGGAGITMCNQQSCDEAQNTWDADCGPSGCTCSYNGSAVCSCELLPPAEACDAIEGNGCCPAPWGDP